MSTTTGMTHCDSATSTSITDALALSSTDRLTPAERKAFGKSDRKAGKVLGVTLTRNDMGQVHHDRKLSPCLSEDQENVQGDNILEDIKVTGAKRSCSRNASAATIVGPLKDLGRVLASGIGMVEKRNKGRMDAGRYKQRVVLGLMRSNKSPGKEGKEELPTGVSDNKACSLPELDESEDTEAPLRQNDQEGEDDLSIGFPRGLDVENSLATPPSPALERRVEEIRLSETTGPLDVSPFTSLCHTTNFEVSSDEESPVLSSGDSFDDMLRPAERAYLDFLIGQNEAEERPIMEMRRESRAALRSRNKILDVLGPEARQAIDEQC
ncbi:uncharacterized protein BJ212DRAFT_511374 [Suillus subaureus]|uniref:Uncharacterized protein n=1 Tax=Suillus subaureus TaxID=48587 RepID=A0A9P7E550_9AGAM|nr:uncharacterized protein BJ212DRAFT_511374 [Suillus subaureus]KAG1811451.1 hypothetical protein BJ212DRAFT_511374 [Suillus subaureus]